MAKERNDPFVGSVHADKAIVAEVAHIYTSEKDVREPLVSQVIRPDSKQIKVETWRSMLVGVERKYKSGKYPGVSFAEILQRQPAYLELESYLSYDAIDALTKDRLGKNPVVIGKVDGKDFVNPPDALRSVLIRELTRIEQSPDLRSALRPESTSEVLDHRKLNIIFDKNAHGFVHTFKGHSFDNRELVEWKLYRVALSSHFTSPGTRLTAIDVSLKSGLTYPSLTFRVMGEPNAKEFKLHAGIPQLWDVVEKPVGSDWFRLTHSVKTVEPFILQAPYSFKIIGSSDLGVNISKLVCLDVDKGNNNEMIFRLDNLD